MLAASPSHGATPPPLSLVTPVSSRILHERAREIDEFDEDLAMLSRRLFDSMYEHDGIGLAAPQVGIDKQMFVMNRSVGRRQVPCY